MVLTEADAGSDLGAVGTRATLDEATGQWHLNGVKRFITNGLADVSLVLARSEEGSSDARGLSMFLVERDDTVKIRRIENKMGIHASPTCEIQYVNTPATLLGKRRFGLMRYAMNLMNGARLAVAAQALGIAEAAYREADKYSRARIQFGKPIRSLPAVGRLLLSMRVDLEATRTLLAETGRWVDLWKVYERAIEEGGSETDPAVRARHKQAQALAETLTPMVKYCATEMGNRVCYQAMQVHGGAGYMREFNIERLFRDVRITNIYEGTSQLQVVAAIGKLLNRSLDPLLTEWQAAEYPADMATEKALLTELTGLFAQAVDALKASPERDRVDYYAVDLVEMAIWVVGGWLMLRDTSARRGQEADRAGLRGVDHAEGPGRGRGGPGLQPGSARDDRGPAAVRRRGRRRLRRRVARRDQEGAGLGLRHRGVAGEDLALDLPGTASGPQLEVAQPGVVAGPLVPVHDDVPATRTRRRPWRGPPRLPPRSRGAGCPTGRVAQRPAAHVPPQVACSRWRSGPRVTRGSSVVNVQRSAW